jgi:hypothetical protein
VKELRRIKSADAKKSSSTEIHDAYIFKVKNKHTDKSGNQKVLIARLFPVVCKQFLGFVLLVRGKNK